MATRYRVINQRVEINGITREVGAVLDESDFKPATGRMIESWSENPFWDVATNNIPRFIQGDDVPEQSELESLLATGHVEEV